MSQDPLELPTWETGRSEVMWPGSQNAAEHLLFDTLIRVILLLAVCTMQLKVQPHMQYVTESELITYYMRPQKDSYVPPWAMVVLVVFIPLFYLLVSLLMTKNNIDAIQGLLAWTLAISINAIITESVKLIVGRPRPDFFYRCFPNGKMTKGLYCTGNLRDIIEGRKSFPSGHSSFAFCSLGFLSISLCGKLGVLSTYRGQAWRVITCLIPLVLASAIGFSRCWDNHHHWQDVFVGSLVGFITSYLCYLQYYNPLDSDVSGYPYAVMEEEYLFDTLQRQYCTSDMDDNVSLMLRLCNKNITECNKKYN